MRGEEAIKWINRISKSRIGTFRVKLIKNGIWNRGWGESQIPKRHIKNPHPDKKPNNFPIKAPFSSPNCLFNQI